MEQLVTQYGPLAIVIVLVGVVVYLVRQARNRGLIGNNNLDDVTEIVLGPLPDFIEELIRDAAERGVKYAEQLDLSGKLAALGEEFVNKGAAKLHLAVKSATTLIENAGKRLGVEIDINEAELTVLVESFVFDLLNVKRVEK